MPDCQSIFHCGIQRKFQAKRGAGKRRLLHRNIASVILKNFLHHRQSHAGAIFLAVAHKRLEKAFADGVWNSRAIICDANFQRAVYPPELDIDFSGT